MLNVSIIIFGKLLSKLFRLLNLGNGSTWPGHIALNLNKHFIHDLLKNSSLQIIVVAGTNGKTTTASLIKTILEKDRKKVLLNQSGANLLNGIASTLLLNATSSGRLSYDFAIFETDENALPHLLKELTPDYLVLLNLFRDQLDRYGEVHTIADKWEASIKHLFSSSEAKAESRSSSPQGRTKLILNADDPEIAYLGLQNDLYSSNEVRSSHVVRTIYFGLDNKNLSKTTRDHAVDSVYCPRCNFPLEYKTNYYSHLGNWFCPDCKLARPELEKVTIAHYPLSGTYNLYNTHAAILVAQTIGVEQSIIESALENFKPAFGRQEIIEVDGKSVQLFLSKNPTSFNQSLQTISDLKGKNLLIILNDRVADGHDVSWIWDTNMEQFSSEFDHITLSGDRCYDLGLRLKYTEEKLQISNFKFQIEENVQKALKHALQTTPNNETLYILPTYTAMLEIRKIITGKKIL